jgi:glutathione S-transferase
MYKLTFSPASPYVRKVLLSSYRAGIEKQIELVTPDSQDDSLLRSQNPLGKIPVLQKPDGSFLFDSRVIIDYFNRLGGGLIPMDGPERDIVLSRSAMAEGLIDASLLVVYSDRYSGGEVPSKVWLELQLGKIDTTLNFLEKDILNWSNPSGFDAANIGLGSALAYMSFRNVSEWKTDRPKLQKWFDNVAYSLPGFSQTAPKG